MRSIVICCLALLGGLLLSGCAKKSTPPPLYSGAGYPAIDADAAARYPIHYSTMPARSHEASVPDEGVSGFPEGHPLAPTTMPSDTTSVHMQSPAQSSPHDISSTMTDSHDGMSHDTVNDAIHD